MPGLWWYQRRREEPRRGLAAIVAFTFLRSVPQSGNFFVSGKTQTVPQAVKLLQAAQVRTVPQYAALKQVSLARAFVQNAHFRLTNTRTITPETAKFLQTTVRTVPQVTKLLRPNLVRIVNQLANLQPHAFINIGSVVNGGPSTITVPSPGVPAGVTIILRMISTLGPLGTSVTDSAGNTYVLDVADTVTDSSTGSKLYFSVFHCHNALSLSAGQVINIPSPGMSIMLSAIADYVPNAVTTGLDSVETVATSNSATEGTVATSGPISQSGADFVCGLVAATCSAAGIPITMTLATGRNFLVGYNPSGQKYAQLGEYEITGVSGTLNEGGTLNTSSAWIVVALAIKINPYTLTNTHLIPQRAVFGFSFTRTVPQSTKLLTTFTRTVPQATVLTKQGFVRTVLQFATLSRAGAPRTIPQYVAVRTTGVHTVPQSVKLTSPNHVHIVPQQAVLQGPGIRFVPQFVALTSVVRHVPQAAALFWSQKRTVPQSAALFIAGRSVRTVPASMYLSIANLTRMVPASTSFKSFGLARIVHASVDFLVSNNVRTVPASMYVTHHFTRIVPQLMNLLGPNTRSVPVSMFLSSDITLAAGVPLGAKFTFSGTGSVDHAGAASALAMQSTMAGAAVVKSRLAGQSDMVSGGSGALGNIFQGAGALHIASTIVGAGVQTLSGAGLLPIHSTFTADSDVSSDDTRHIGAPGLIGTFGWIGNASILHTGSLTVFEDEVDASVTLRRTGHLTAAEDQAFAGMQSLGGDLLDPIGITVHGVAIRTTIYLDPDAIPLVVPISEDPMAAIAPGTIELWTGDQAPYFLCRFAMDTPEKPPFNISGYSVTCKIRRRGARQNVFHGAQQSCTILSADGGVARYDLPGPLLGAAEYDVQFVVSNGVGAPKHTPILKLTLEQSL